MGTNFYWKHDTVLPTGEHLIVDHMDPAVHIGKRSAGVGFTWAQDPEKVLEICRQRPEEMIVQDEYGHQYSGDGFRTAIADWEWRLDSLGQYFS